MRASLIRLLGAVRPMRSDADIAEELRSHAELLAQQYRRRGLSEREARRAAAATFGSMPAAIEAYRDRRGVPVFEHWLRDCRHAVRSLNHTRTLSVSLILVLALGIGLVTTIATLFHAVAVRPLPLPQPDRVVKLSLTLAGAVDRRVDGHASQFSYPELVLYQQTTRSLSGVAGARHQGGMWRRDGRRQAVNVALVTANYFDTLQVRPALGRLLTDRDAREPAAVISHRLWRRAFEGAPDALGRSMRIDRTEYSVIGVAEPSFAGTELDPVDVWVPLEVAAPGRGETDRLTDASLSWLHVVGRLENGSTLVTAKAEAGVIAARVDRMHPGQRTFIHVSEAAALDPGLLHSDDRYKVLEAGMGVGFLGVVLLLICSSNAAGLLLARGAARQSEMAIRIALGAGRWRIGQQLLIESAVVALAGAVVGLCLCTATLRLAAHALPLPDYFEGFVPDMTVLSFALASAFGSALLFGIVPAMLAANVDPLPMLKRGAVSLGPCSSASRIRHGLVVLQVAVSLVLLVASALLARGVERAFKVDTGFSLSNLYAITVDAPESDPPSLDRASLIRRLSVALHAADGDAEAGLATVVPFSGKGFSRARTGDLAPAIPTQFNLVDRGYFRALGVSPLAGRAFNGRDDRGTVVVNARLAQAFWGGARAALGQSLHVPEMRTGVRSTGPAQPMHHAESVFQAATVVGVVPTLQSTDVGVPDGPTFYLPMGDDDRAHASLLVRARSRESLTRSVENAIGRGDAEGAVVSIEERLASQTGPARIAGAIAGLIGVLALLVAAAGIYGIVAHSVISRAHEIAVRVACGASRARVLRLVFGSSLRAVAIGAALGTVVVLVVALAAARTLEPILFGIRPLDPLALGAAVAFLVALTVPAAYLPARRAVAAGPLEALRHV